MTAPPMIVWSAQKGWYQTCIYAL